MNNIFYDKIMGDRRYIFTKNKRNWIWAHGPKDSSLKNILSSQHTCFYSSIESMFVNLLETRFREHVTEFTVKNFRKSLKKAFSEVRIIGETLDAVTWDKIKRGNYCQHCNKKKE